MIFWIISGTFSVGFWLIRANQRSESNFIAQGIEQLFFCSIIAIILSSLGVPILDFKTGSIIESSELAYAKLLYVSILLILILTTLYLN